MIINDEGVLVNVDLCMLKKDIKYVKGGVFTVCKSNDKQVYIGADECSSFVLIAIHSSWDSLKV